MIIDSLVFMIIDDDIDDRIFFKMAVKGIQLNTMTLEAKSGIEALQILRTIEQLPDYIFLDINMPRMDGRECLSEMKRDVALKHIPIIMYSTSFSDKSIAEFLALGAFGTLNKPTDMDTLPAHILDVIRIAR